MFQVENFSTFTKRNILVWLTLAFQGGIINVGGFLACHRFVTHTTGFATFFGTELVKGDLHSALGMLTVPIFFLIGCMVSAIIINRRREEGKRPLYFLSFGIIATFMFILSYIGYYEGFGKFGSPIDISSDFSLLAALCLSSGIQNATVTTASNSIVRTTHLTGLTTDLGVGLVKLMNPELSPHSRKTERQSNFLRFGIISFFILGSAIGAFLFTQFHYLGFLLPALISSGLMFYSLYNQRRSK